MAIHRVRLQVTSGGRPLGGATIHQLSPLQGRLGITDESGYLDLDWDTEQPVVLQVVAYCGYWDGVFPLEASPDSQPVEPLEIPLELEALPVTDRPWWLPEDVGGLATGIRVGVIDTGCGPHPALADVVPAGSWVNGKRGGPEQTLDCERHGTHVIGIIAAHRQAGHEMAGIAEQAQTFMLRVADQVEGTALTIRNGDLAAAIDTLIEDHRIDLLNLSLGGEGFDSDEYDALTTAIEQGVLPLASAGNSGQLLYPAAYEGVVAVGALGRRSQGSPHARSGFYLMDQSVAENDPSDFYVPDFSQYEEPVEYYAAGVEIISTVPGREADPAPYAAMTGSSMAVAVATATLACSLALDPTYLAQPRDRSRAEHARSVLRRISCEREIVGRVERLLVLPEAIP